MESTWRLDPVAITLAAVGLVLYVQAFVRLRARAGATHAAWCQATQAVLGALQGG